MGFSWQAVVLRDFNFTRKALLSFTYFGEGIVSGYDFISTVAISACIPLLYYAILKQWDWKKFLKRMALAVISVVTAVFLSLAILAGQIGSLTGSYQDGIQHIVNSVGRRTYGDPEQFPIYTTSLQAKAYDVVLVYLKGEGIFRNYHLSFGELALIFLLFSSIFFLFLFLKKIRSQQRRKGIALIAATWLAFLGSLSTYVIFKGASYIHTHLYYIVWHLPFTILGFAMCAFVLKVILQSFHGHFKEQQRDLSTK